MIRGAECVQAADKESDVQAQPLTAFVNKERAFHPAEHLVCEPVIVCSLFRRLRHGQMLTLCCGYYFNAA